MDARQLYEQSLDCLTSVSSIQPQNRVPEARVNNGSEQLFFHFVTWADCCAWSAPLDWRSFICGVKAWSASIIFAYVSPRPLISFSLPFQHNSCFPLFGQQLTAAMWTVLSVFVEGAWSLLIARVWGFFRASLVPAVLVEKTRQSHRMKSEEVRNVVRQRCCLTTLKASSPWSRQLDIGGRFRLARNKAWRG